MLSSLFGAGKLDGLASAIGRSSGINQSSAGSLLGALAPVVLGALGREQRSQGLDAQGLARLLTNQKDSIVRALPAGLASELGPTGLLDGVADRLGEGVSTAAGAGRATAAAATRPAGVTTTARQLSSSSLLPWIIGIAAVLALAWLAYHFLYRGEQVREGYPGRRAGGKPDGRRRRRRPAGHGRVQQRDHGAQWRHRCRLCAGGPAEAERDQR